MNIIKAKCYNELSKMAALLISAQVLLKPDSVLGLSTGTTPLGAYTELIRLFNEAGLDFSNITTFNLDEYYGMPAADKNSFYHYMHSNLFSYINISRDLTNFPDATAQDAQAECTRYEKAIEDAGGIDLQVLGIGHNGHIGFNEPADYFPDVTHHVKLADSTIDANSRFYKSRDDVPKSAITMGIGTIMRAKSVLLLISGKDKREIAQKALFGKVTPQVPASILQYHKDCTAILAV